MRDTIALVVCIVMFGCLFIPGTGCKQGWAAADLFARKLDCALQNRDLPDAEIFAKCALQPEDVKDIMAIVGKERSHDAALRKAGCFADGGK